MTRDDLAKEVNRMSAKVNRLPGIEVTASFEQRFTGISERRRANTESFRERLRAARPDLQAFRMRPWRRQILIRTVWRTQALFGFEGWEPRRERFALLSLSPRNTQEQISPNHLRRLLDEFSLVSDRHDFWVKNTTRGARLFSASESMGGYRATPWPGCKGQFNFGVYKSGLPPKRDEFIFGVAWRCVLIQ